jgi:hypothetical protein
VGDERRAKKAAKEYERQLATWSTERENCAQMLHVVQTFPGTTDPGLLLKRGEAIFLTVSGTALIEDRRGPGHYSGRSQGISFPIATIGGRPVRYRVGASKGHFVQGTPSPTAIDTGTTYVTDQRVVFRGGKQTRECAFAKLVGYDHTDDGSTVLSVSNRQTPTVIHYGRAVADEFAFRLELALAHYQDKVGALVGQLEASLAEIDARRPAPPPARPDVDTPAGPEPVAVPAPTGGGADPTLGTGSPDPGRPVDPPPSAPGVDATSALPGPGWFTDPWGQAPLRWWDGSQWTGNVHSR